MNNPFAAPATLTSSASSRGGRRSEEVGRRSGGGTPTDHLLPTYREGGGGGPGGEPQPALFATPAAPVTATTKPRRRQPLNVWAHTTTTGQCPTCGKPTINALENTDMPIPNTADPHTLTSTQELTALRSGRHTYDYDTRARTLQRRTIHHIRGHPPETDTNPVLPQHHCTQPLGTPLPPTPTTQETRPNEHPPF